MNLVALIISVVAAVAPTLVYTLIFYWADRYEREPAWLLLIAFIWGAIPAIVVSLIGEVALGATFVTEPGSTASALLEGVLIAPVIEEVAKGAALLLIFRLMAHEFDGVLDGLVYGALIGFGFAMTENFFYFIGAFDEGGFSSLSLVIFLRSVLFGLNHAVYTSMAGIGFGLARQTTERRRGNLLIIAGLLLAIAIHALHNLGATLASVNPLGLLISLAIATAGVALVVMAVVLSWRQERIVIQRELWSEIGVTLSRQEYDTLVDRWHWPVRTRNSNEARREDRLALSIKLAFSKARLRRHGSSREPELTELIAGMRERLGATVQS